MISNVSSNIYAVYVGIIKWGGTGTGPGQFNIPLDSAVDSSGNVFVADSGNNRIQVFRLVSDNCPTPTKEVVPGVCFIKMWGKPEGADGQLRGPSGVAVNSSGDVFVADSGNNRIQVFKQ